MAPRLLLTWLLVGASLLAGPRRAPVDASAGAEADASRGAPAAADTILRRPETVPAAVRAGLAAAAAQPALRLGLKRLAPWTAVGGEGSPPPSRAAVADGPGSAAPTAGRVSASAELAPVDVVIRAWSRRWSQEARPFDFLPEPQPERTAPAAPGQDLPRFVTDYADLGLNVRTRLELGGDWTRFQPCDEQFKVSCTPTLIPQLSPEVQFGVQVEGTIAERVHVDVDFDQAREFDAANRINIFYEGAEDDILRRLDVGDVTFRLPSSRFLTEGIPAGNFGFQAEGQLGPLDFQAVWAQQRGDLNAREFRLTGVGDRRGFVQEDTLVLDDADFVRGQFFFLVDPRAIDDYPHIDALDLDPASVAPGVGPGDEPVQLYRYENDPVFRQQVEGFIQADAVAEGAGGRVVESGWFRYLQPGVDYFVHPSGLWVALRTPLARDEMLAVTYVTAAGDTVGDYNPERIHNAGGRPTLKLLKASGANHQPGRPTWDYEMHQIYRVSSSPDVERASVELVISLGERSAGRTFKRAPTGEDLTFLQLFGLDEEAPADALDPAFVYSPADEFFGGEAPVQGTFVVFPTLRPFAEPPPVEGRGMSADETARILGPDANRRIYDEEDPFERDNAGRFRLNLSYRLRSEGVISSFSLGALGIRDGSERIRLGDRLLVRGVDYEIDYDVGQVRLLEPEALFTSAPDAPIRATWEQRSLFQVSPTQVFGLRTHARLGDRGGLDVLSLYRSERTVLTRPQLGTEPAAALLGGVSADFEADASWLDRILESVPGVRRGGASTLRFSGEVAFSLPNPNTRGAAFVDDFDAADALPVSLLATDWTRGSVPSSPAGVEGVLPTGFSVGAAVPLVWQHTWVVESVVGDSVGVHEGLFPRQEIDRRIRVAGSEVREPSLLLSFGGRGPVTRPSWRSVTTTLSPTGLDLTKTDFLEVYVSGAEDAVLVFDLGVVSEDALFVDSLGNTSGSRPEGGGMWGLGLLDQEADPRLGEIWSSDLDRRGVWGESCLAEPGRIYRIADPRAVCTRGNGRRDSEDLDLDGNLDTSERFLRYVVTLDGRSPFLARTRDETGTGFQLYRIPIRGAGALEVGGAFSEADLRAVRHLRLSVVAAGNRRVEMARMRLVGSRWIRRAGRGVLDGIGGDTVAAFGRVEVRSVSRVTEGDAYVSPPGVLEQLVDPTSAFSGQGIEFNEKALGFTFEDIAPGGRAEVYQRFPQRPRDFLSYRQLRLWVVPRSGDFGPDRPHFFFVKVGSDPDNFYLFRTRLRAPPSPAGVTAGDWLPEVVVDFGEWLDLRRRAEETLLTSPRLPGDPPVTVWAADSAYAVVLSDRGRAPDLANVRELSLGVWNEGAEPLAGEVWVDELRLGRPVRDGGLASSLRAELSGSGVVEGRATYTGRGAFFRQLRDAPSYQSDRVLTLGSTLHLDRLAPTSWGVDVPLSVTLDRVAQDPVFLPNSDVRADRLEGLRATEARRTRVELSFRKRTPSARPWLGLLVDGLDGRVSYVSSRESTVTSVADADGVTAGLHWSREPEVRDVPLLPGRLAELARAILPGFLEDGVAGARLRWTPERISVGSSYQRRESRIFRYEAIVETPADSAVPPTRAPREAVEAVADVRFRPFPALAADVGFLSTRDLLEPERAATDGAVRELLRAERSRRLGVDLGWETHRNVRTRLSFRPTLVSWLQSEADWSTLYRSDRNSGFLTQAGAPDGPRLTRNARGERDLRLTLGLRSQALAERLLGAPREAEDPGVRQLRGMITALQPVRVTYRSGLSSRFNRDPVRPPGSFQFGFGGLEDFRVMDGDTAATLTDVATWSAQAGARLPAGASVALAYEQTAATTLDVRSDRDLLQRRWPDLRVTLPPLAPPSFTGVRSVRLSSGVVRRVRGVSFGGRGLQRRLQREVEVPVDLSVTWPGTLVTAYRASVRRGRGEDPTGDTERLESTHRLSVSSTFAPPWGLASRLDRPVRMALLVGYIFERDCRATAARPECVPFVDQLRRNVSLTLDTSVGGFEVGLQMSYDDRQSFVGQRSGSTQLQLNLFGQLEFGPGATGAGPFR